MFTNFEEKNPHNYTANQQYSLSLYKNQLQLGHFQFSEQLCVFDFYHRCIFLINIDNNSGFSPGPISIISLQISELLVP